MKHNGDLRTPFPVQSMCQLLRTLSISFLIILFFVFGMPPSGHADTISCTGTLSDKNGTAIGQATAEVVGANPPITTETDSLGAYNLSGITAGNPFVLKFSKAGYLPTYPAVQSSNANLQEMNWSLYATRGQVNALWTSQGAIWARVKNKGDNTSVGGATVVATSTRFPGTTYPVYYCDDSGSCRTDLGTYNNGRSLIANAPEDTVIVQAFKDGWSFSSGLYHIFTDGVAIQSIGGIPTASNITFAGYAKDNVNAALPGVAVQMVGNDAVTATTDGSGYFNLAGLPNSSGFFIKYSKAGYIPVYMSRKWYAGPISTPLSQASVLYPNGQFPIASGKSAIQGRVLNGTNGTPVGGAVVTLHSARSPSGNAYVVNYCDNAGVCSAVSSTYSNGSFVVFNVDPGEVIYVRAGKNGWNFYDTGQLVTFSDAMTQTLLWSSMVITPSVENRHSADGNYRTKLNINIGSFNGSLPDGISAITVTGPDGNVIATKPDLTYDSEYKDFTVLLPGQPALGTYTFTVTGNGMTATGTDVQTINRNLPVPDKNTFTYNMRPHPTFTWPAVDYTECPLYYQLIIRDMAGKTVYFSSRVLGMLSHTVPAGTLHMGQTYQFQVGLSDSSSGVLTQNSSRSDLVTFKLAGKGIAPLLLLLLN